MSGYLQQAYNLGKNYANFVKSASRLRRYSLVAKDYLQPEDVNRMIIGALIGGGSGALIGGMFNRRSGLIGGGLAGAIAANPKLFLALVNGGSRSISNFANGITSLKGST